MARGALPGGPVASRSRRRTRSAPALRRRRSLRGRVLPRRGAGSPLAKASAVSDSRVGPRRAVRLGLRRRPRADRRGRRARRARTLQPVTRTAGPGARALSVAWVVQGDAQVRAAAHRAGARAHAPRPGERLARGPGRRRWRDRPCDCGRRRFARRRSVVGQHPRVRRGRTQRGRTGVAWFASRRSDHRFAAAGAGRGAQRAGNRRDRPGAPLPLGCRCRPPRGRHAPRTELACGR